MRGTPLEDMPAALHCEMTPSAPEPDDESRMAAREERWGVSVTEERALVRLERERELTARKVDSRERRRKRISRLEGELLGKLLEFSLQSLSIGGIKRSLSILNDRYPLEEDKEPELA